MISVTQKNDTYCIIIEKPNKKELAIIGELQRLEQGNTSEWEFWSLGKRRPTGNGMDDAFEVYRSTTDYEKFKDEEIPFGDTAVEPTNTKKEYKQQSFLDDDNPFTTDDDDDNPFTDEDKPNDSAGGISWA